MDTEKMKNMMVLKNLPSNIIDEAIVILKPNVKLKSLDLAENKKSEKENKESLKNDKKYIIDEAEMILNNYMSQIEKEKNSSLKINKKIENKYKRLKAIAILLGVLFFASFIIR